jgi:hypothetical protein
MRTRVLTTVISMADGEAALPAGAELKQPLLVPFVATWATTPIYTLTHRFDAAAEPSVATVVWVFYHEGVPGLSTRLFCGICHACLWITSRTALLRFPPLDPSQMSERYKQPEKLKSDGRRRQFTRCAGELAYTGNAI